jgi:hypothetical protein
MHFFESKAQHLLKILESNHILYLFAFINNEAFANNICFTTSVYDRKPKHKTEQLWRIKAHFLRGFLPSLAEYDPEELIRQDHIAANLLHLSDHKEVGLDEALEERHSFWRTLVHISCAWIWLCLTYQTFKVVEVHCGTGLLLRG